MLGHIKNFMATLPDWSDIIEVSAVATCAISSPKLRLLMYKTLSKRLPAVKFLAGRPEPLVGLGCFGLAKLK